jgi:hypothetical protein
MVILCAEARAQQSDSEPEQRINGAFTTLARSALDALLAPRSSAQHSIETDNLPLPFQGVSAPPRNESDWPPMIGETGPADGGSSNAPSAPAAAAPAEPNLDQGPDRIADARLPRPRPGEPSEANGESELSVAAAWPVPSASQAGQPEARALLGSVPQSPKLPEARVIPVGASPDQSAPQKVAPSLAEVEAAAAALRAALTQVTTGGPDWTPSVALPANGSDDRSRQCLSPTAVADPDRDFRRNLAALTAPGMCITQTRFQERRRPWIVQTVDSGRAGPVWVVPHDDEDVAFDNAVFGLATYGGALFTVETGGKRNQDGIDPNRNFSDAKASCAQLGDAASPLFTGAFAKLIEPGRKVIALHNNTGGKVDTTGLGHISIKTVPKEMRKRLAKNQDGPLAGPDALVLLAAVEPVGAEVDRRMVELRGKGVNTVLEQVRRGQGDCSLADYVVLDGRADYFNVTVDANEADKQRRIIDVLMKAQPAVAALP